MDPLCDHLLMSRKREDGTEEDVGTLRWYVRRALLPPPYRSRVSRLASRTGMIPQESFSSPAKTSSRFQVPTAVETRPRGHHQVDARDRSRPDPLRSARGTRPRTAGESGRRDPRQVEHRVARVLAKDCGRVLHQDGMAFHRTGFYRGGSPASLT